MFGHYFCLRSCGRTLLSISGGVDPAGIGDRGRGSDCGGAVVAGVKEGGSRSFPLGRRGKLLRKSVKDGFDRSGTELAAIEPGWLGIAPEGAGGRG